MSALECTYFVLCFEAKLRPIGERRSEAATRLDLTRKFLHNVKLKSNSLIATSIGKTSIRNEKIFKWKNFQAGWLVCWFQLKWSQALNSFGSRARACSTGKSLFRGRSDRRRGAGSINQYYLQACKLNLNIETTPFLQL